ncbi:MAG: protein kinase [Myxococcaceae bacterium]|nr:protein kinase [Myxococcaceae bacterium]
MTHAEQVPAHGRTPAGSLQAFGQYRLVRKLATGGMADIFLAKQVGPQGFERNVVIKRLLPGLAEQPDFVAMFLDEARLAARLEHPHIVQIHDLGEIDGQYFLCMEYLAGEDLSHLLRSSLQRTLPVPLKLAARIVSQAAHGLHHAHELTDEHGEPLDVVHRDVTPSNLFVTYQGHVKVLDFGIAKASSCISTTDAGTLKGKVLYLAPERVMARPADRRSDVYSLGLCLYEALTLTRPFLRENELAILKAVLDGTCPKVSELRPDVPPELEVIVARAMARQVEERYQSAAELAADLDEYLLGFTTTTVNAEMRAWMRALVGEERLRSRSQLPRLSALHPAMPRLSDASASGATPAPGAKPRRLGAPTPPLLMPLEEALEEVTEYESRVLPWSTRRKRGALASGVGALLLLTAVALWVTGILPGALLPGAEDSASVVAGDARKESPALDAQGHILLVERKAALLPITEDAPDWSRRSEARRRAPTGRLTLDTVPWTDVFLGNRRLGETPLVEAVLPAGRHTLRLVNEQQGIKTTLKVEVREGRLTVKRVEL